MYGVVLWSDQSSDRALIWCEDHGNLAFCNSEDLVGAGLQSGDVVTFAMSQEQGLRIARDIRLVAAEEYPALADALREAKAEAQDLDKSKETKILPFEHHRRARPVQSLGATTGQHG